MIIVYFPASSNVVHLQTAQLRDRALQDSSCCLHFSSTLPFRTGHYCRTRLYLGTTNHSIISFHHFYHSIINPSCNVGLSWYRELPMFCRFRLICPLPALDPPSCSAVMISGNDVCCT